ncbi:unnamed protein product, partial [Allacma fusca]
SCPSPETHPTYDQVLRCGPSPPHHARWCYGRESY